MFKALLAYKGSSAGSYYKGDHAGSILCPFAGFRAPNVERLYSAGPGWGNLGSVLGGTVSREVKIRLYTRNPESVIPEMGGFASIAVEYYHLTKANLKAFILENLQDAFQTLLLLRRVLGARVGTTRLGFFTLPM